MALMNRFFGTRDGDEDRGRLCAAKASEEDKRCGLQILLNGKLRLSAAAIQKRLRQFSPALTEAEVEFDVAFNESGNLLGLAGWGKHVIQLLGMDFPMPAGPVERCLAPSHYAMELKDEARLHDFHILLWYVGRDPDPTEQYTALAAVAAAFHRFGGIVVLNETGCTSFPLKALAEAGDGASDALEVIRSLPLTILFCGFVKYMMEDSDRVWMRTHGCEKFGLPNFAGLAEGHHEGQRWFEIFNNMLNYLRDSGNKLLAGETMQIEEEEYLKARKPKKREKFLTDDHELLILEIIGPDEVNPH